MRLGILTGGGDVPGLNACIKAVVNRAADNGWETVGLKRGWAGPLYYDLENGENNSDATVALDRTFVRHIDRRGGTILHTSRTNPAKVAADDLPGFLDPATLSKTEDGRFDCTPHVLGVMEALGIDAMIPVGGDDTLSFGAHLSAQGFPVVAIPKTMDNDVNGTDFCIGFGTAVSRSVELIDALRTPAASHERIAVIELFGRNSGETALISGYVVESDKARAKAIAAGDFESMRQSSEELKGLLDMSISSILTPEQVTAWKEKTQRRQRGGGGGGGFRRN